jgi:6-phosphogluconate dehydrogenase
VELGMVGLGKMGSNMTRRLLEGGHRVLVYDRDTDAAKVVVALGAVIADSLEDLVSKLATPRAVWVMVPAGEPTQSVVAALSEMLGPDDTVIDGGNSNYKDSQRRATLLAERGMHFVDVGTSGGVWGLTEGYSLMIGGERAVVDRLQSVFETLAPAKDNGWGHVGPCGAGHFVKMVHNGIEYGLMQAYAEGFEILQAKEGFDLDLHQIAEIWRYGSVVRSWLLDLTAGALSEDQNLSEIKGWVADSGEGRWTVAEAIDEDVPAPIITLSLLMRLVSQQDQSYAAKLLAAMRNQFGGHAVLRETDEEA